MLCFKDIRLSNKLLSILLLIPLTACSGQTAQLGSQTPERKTEKGNSSMQTCRNVLHKVENRDDLIKQMYATAFKNNCLYELSADELQKTWGIPVFTSAPDPKKVDTPLGMYVVKSEPDYQTNFYIALTDSALKKQKTLFPEMNFPSFLPEPKKAKIPENAHPEVIPFTSSQEGQIKSGYHYFWRENNREMVATNSGNGAIIALTFYSNLKLSPMTGF